jgi:transposase
MTYSREQRDRIAAADARGLSPAEVAAQCFCSIDTVYRVRREKGRGGRRGAKRHPETSTVLRLLMARSMARDAIAEHCGCSRATVYNIAQAHGLTSSPAPRRVPREPGKRGRRLLAVPGQQYGELTVAGRDGRAVYCSCSCGGIRTVRIDKLRSGKVTRCTSCSKVSRREAFKVAKATAAVANRPPRGSYTRIDPGVRAQIVQWLRDEVQGAEISRRTGVSTTTISKIKGSLS